MSRLALIAVVAVCLSSAPAVAAAGVAPPPPGHCRYMILTHPQRGAMARVVVNNLNYGQALNELRLFRDDGMDVRLGQVCQ